MPAAQQQLVVIGGGAAGFFCAVNAARLNPSLRVTILEKSSKLLSKVKVSGGGRCNVTHACFDIGEMSRHYPRGGNFVKKAFHQFFTTDTIDWFKQRGVALKQEKDGRMFPVTDSSQTIIDCLLKETAEHGVNIVMHAEVLQIDVHDTAFLLQLNNGRSLQADFVCIASGGYPKAAMFDWLRRLGHTISEPVPSLFTFNIPGHPIRELMGVSVEKARIKILGTRLIQEGPLLITHWGLSGPAVLKSSAWGARELAAVAYSFTVSINWLAAEDHHEQSLKEQWKQYRVTHASKKAYTTNLTPLPNRLWEFLLSQSGVADGARYADIPVKTENLLIKNLVDYQLNVQGKTTFKEEFVTAGGIRLEEIDHQTMMSKKKPGLFFTGEVMDVDGITGGFNFQHAWTSGFIAGSTIAKSV